MLAKLLFYDLFLVTYSFWNFYRADYKNHKKYQFNLDCIEDLHYTECLKITQYEKIRKEYHPQNVDQDIINFEKQNMSTFVYRCITNLIFN